MATRRVIAGSLASSALPSAAWRRTLGCVASTVAPLTVPSSTEISPTRAPGRLTLLTTTPHLVTLSAPDTRIQRPPAEPPSWMTMSPGANATSGSAAERASMSDIAASYAAARAGATFEASASESAPLVVAIARALAAGEHRGDQVLAPAQAHG